MDPLKYTEQHQARFLTELKDFLRIPSVSTQAEHRPDMQAAAEWLRDRLREAGMPMTAIMETPGHPLVYAEWLVSHEVPTVLIYGHYDVQPPDPLELWQTEPFEPTQRNEDLFARGASDDKGQLYLHVKALEAFHKSAGAPPVNIKYLFEGEEESGSPNLAPFIESHQELLAADIAVISDSHILGREIPAIIYALRGLSYVEVELTGPEHDLHSGIYGGAVHNPIHALSELIAGLHDEQGRITIPGFYDNVRELPAEERAELSKIPFEREKWLEEATVSSAWGEPEYSIIERTSARPTLDVNGIWGGYIEPGAKTVLPSKAHAKISMRLVPDQNHERITQLIKKHLQESVPPTVTIQVHDLHGGAGAIIRRDSPEMKAAFDAYADTFGREPVFIREGGSIPVVAVFQEVLGIETIMLGFGLPDDNLHAPNEKFHIPNFYKGIETVIRFLQNLGEQ